MPFLPVRGFAGSDYLKVRPDYKLITDPFTGQAVVVVPPIQADVCLLHGFVADEAGNLLIDRASDADLAAQGAELVVATVEEKVREADLGVTPWAKRLPWVYVDYLVEAPGAAKPTACPGRYKTDFGEMKAYLAAAVAGRIEEYLSQEVFKEHRS